MSIYDCKVILCGPAVGKTYLANCDDRFIDIDGEKAKYKYNLHNISQRDFESGKLKRGAVINNDSNEYAINLLKETIDNGKIALISYHEALINYLVDNNIDYCLIYADHSLREEYKKRMEDRGNPEDFVYEMTNEDAWDKFHEKDENDTRPKYKIKLKEGQYLSDIKDLFID